MPTQASSLGTMAQNAGHGAMDHNAGHGADRPAGSKNEIKTLRSLNTNVNIFFKKKGLKSRKLGRIHSSTYSVIKNVHQILLLAKEAVLLPV
jgi:hypothetical protein